MSKAVLISIQPKWCEKIANGEKTVEVRKTQPKLKTPFKCYIYCTMAKDMLWVLEGRLREPNLNPCSMFNAKAVGGATKANGKVIGEFVCDCITPWPENETPPIPLAETCLKYSDIRAYAGESEMLFLWHISDLQIYDTPKDLSEFMKPCENDLYCEICAMYSEFQDKCGNKALTLSRPPQSWCYVEELPGGDG